MQNMKRLYQNHRNPGPRPRPLGVAAILAIGVLSTFLAAECRAAKVTMKDGRVLEGQMGEADGVAEDPNNPSVAAGPVDVKRLLVFDDGWRRIFVPRKQVAPQAPVPSNQNEERIEVKQNVARAGRYMGTVGPILKITPFDEFGRRIFTMNTTDGPVSIVQGITSITPTFTTVEGIAIGGRSIVWKMHVATSSIPRETLAKIIAKAMEISGSDDDLAAVRIYLQGERYEEAYAELRRVMTEHPDEKALESQARELKQMSARRLVEELQMRSGSGQHELVTRALASFPSENVAGATLQHVRELLAKYDEKKERIKKIISEFDRLMDELKYEGDRKRLEKIRAELGERLNFNTLPRMAAFEQHLSDKQLSAGKRLATAVSGWLLGSDHAIDNLAVALSLVDVREQVALYMHAATPLERQDILERLKTLEGATVVHVSRLLAQMDPPLAEANPPTGLIEHAFPNIENEPDVDYFVQLPPEYDPLRKYPTIVTLNGAGSTPQMQIDWWAGEQPEKGQRRGQATRRGYITIAVRWQKGRQSHYEYSAREHHAVLGSLRDACRRYAIDTDRVFLSGHSMGGDAAWDIALAHPDLWAGVIPIVASANKYCALYWQNAELVPFYFVCGERDANKMKENASELDRYLRRGFDVTVVEFQGRGHEHFHDEIQKLFDWIGRRRRNFFPREFRCSTMRPWDNFFWWAEVSGLPARTILLPEEWDRIRHRQPLVVEGKITPNGSLRIKSGSGQTTLWLSPELVDFEKKVSILAPGSHARTRREDIQPSLETLLEDVRTRGDRQHPFWAKIEL